MSEDTVFEIFRAADAKPEDGIPIMRHEPMTPTMLEGAQRVMEAGLESGHENRLLFCAAGLSLTYVWFKSFYPLPRHSHDTDCLYYVLGGTLRLGTQDIGKGDGFFIGAGVPYAYTPGENGVEVLEFRAATNFNIKLLANNPAFWDRAAQTVLERQAGWARETRASEN
jgi:hypothetical protein